MTYALLVISFAVFAGGATAIRTFALEHATSQTNQLLMTFIINVAGSGILGALHQAGDDAELIVGTAGAGALTTFSTFALQVDDLWRHGQRREAVVYASVSVTGGLLAAALGIELVT